MTDLFNVTAPPYENFCDEFGKNYETCQQCPLYSICEVVNDFEQFIQDFDINRNTSAEDYVKKFLEWNNFPQKLIDLVKIEG